MQKLIIETSQRVPQQDLDKVLPSGKQRLLVLLVAACLPAVAGANNAGSVDFASGNVMVVYSNGNRETLTKGMQLSVSDTVRTGWRGMAHIRFTDGGYVSVQKNSVFRIDEYEYNDPAQASPVATKNTNKGFFSLLSGGFRAITGFLGAENYQIRTPVATIGIRGTKYFAELGRSLTFNVADGAIEVCNTAGCQFFRENEFGYIENNASLITRLRDMGLDVVVSEEKGSTIETVERDEAFTFKITEVVNDDGEPIVLAATGPSCSNANCVAAFGWVDSIGNYNVTNTTGLTGTFENSALISHDGGNRGMVADAVGSATAQSAGSTPDIAWGRWTGGTTSAGFSAVHYVVGTPTPNVNSLTGARSFSVSGFTTPTTTISGLGAFNGVSGNLNADFTNAAVTLDFTVDYANADYRLSAASFSPLFISPDGAFAGSVSVAGGLPSAGSAANSCDFGGCTGAISGFFAGANASNAGLTYHVDGFNAGDMTGAVVLEDSGPGVLTPPQF
jgi:hypothetical protein